MGYNIHSSGCRSLVLLLKAIFIWLRAQTLCLVSKIIIYSVHIWRFSYKGPPEGRLGGCHGLPPSQEALLLHHRAKAERLDPPVQIRSPAELKTT